MQIREREVCAAGSKRVGEWKRRKLSRENIIDKHERVLILAGALSAVAMQH